MNKLERDLRLGEVFTPAAPIDRLSLFAGRDLQRRAVLDAILQRGRHAVLFGERGVGKTSLASVLREYLEEVGQSVIAPRVNCDDGDDYSAVWRKAFDDLQFIEHRRGVGFAPELKEVVRSANDLIGSQDAVTPHAVRLLLEKLGTQTLLVVIIDEFDRVADRLGTQMADTIKMLSDQSVPATLVLVGVGESVSALIDKHESIERALAQVLMPRMSISELQQIVEGGLAEVEMTVEPRARDRIATLSQGLPHYTHLISLAAARVANDADSGVVELADVTAGIRSAAVNAQETITTTHHRAVMSARSDSLHSRVALACALAENDELGYFTAGSVRRPMATIMGRPYAIASFAKHMNEFCRDEREAILEKIGKRRNYRYRFRNPLLPPYIVMNGITQGLISDDDAARIQDLHKEENSTASSVEMQSQFELE
jgi:Cdc6-like AAA superfamily ATPase